MKTLMSWAAAAIVLLLQGQFSVAQNLGDAPIPTASEVRGGSFADFMVREMSKATLVELDEASTSRIYGGRPAKPGAWPAQVPAGRLEAAHRLARQRTPRRVLQPGDGNAARVGLRTGLGLTARRRPGATPVDTHCLGRRCRPQAECQWKLSRWRRSVLRVTHDAHCGIRKHILVLHDACTEQCSRFSGPGGTGLETWERSVLVARLAPITVVNYFPRKISMRSLTLIGFWGVWRLSMK